MAKGTLALTLCIACLSCTERKAHLAASGGEIKLNGAPAPQHRLDFSFDDKVDLVGYDLDPPKLSPDRPFKVTWYWRVRAPLGEGVRLFTHLAEANGTTLLNLDSQRALRERYPEATWKAGDFIRDEQNITLPAGFRSPAAVLYVGFYKGARRFEVTRGKADSERRAEALRLPVALAAPANDAVPELQARRLAKPLAIDGKLDEPQWRAADLAGPMVRTMTGAPGDFRAVARVLYDDERIYVGFEVADDYLKSTFERPDDHLWEQDCVEIMFDPGGDAKNYFELQVSPRGVHFDTRYDARRDPRPFGHVDWDSRVEAKVVAKGTLNDSAEDEGYTVELAVPWTAFATGEPPAAPPAPGDSWRINFFVMDAREVGQRAVGWSPPRIGDFHTLHRFGRVVFVTNGTTVR